MNKTELNLYWCFPSLMNLHGERGSIMAMEHWASCSGIDLRVVRIEAPQDLPSLHDADALFFGPCEVREARLVADLMRDRAQELRDVCAQGVPLLAVGSAGSLFAQHTQCLEKSDSFEGLGLFPMRCKEREAVYGDDLWVRANSHEMEIIGCQIQTVDTYLDDPNTAFARTVYGRGNNGADDEGCRVDNAVFTNALGPLLAKNPRFAVSVLVEAARIRAQRYGISSPELCDIPSSAFEYEDASAELIRAYIGNKMAS